MWDILKYFFPREVISNPDQNLRNVSETHFLFIYYFTCKALCLMYIEQIKDAAIVRCSWITQGKHLRAYKGGSNPVYYGGGAKKCSQNILVSLY